MSNNLNISPIRPTGSGGLSNVPLLGSVAKAFAGHKIDKVSLSFKENNMTLEKVLTVVESHSELTKLEKKGQLNIKDYVPLALKKPSTGEELEKKDIVFVHINTFNSAIGFNEQRKEQLVELAKNTEDVTELAVKVRGRVSVALNRLSELEFQREYLDQKLNAPIDENVLQKADNAVKQPQVKKSIEQFQTNNLTFLKMRTGGSTSLYNPRTPETERKQNLKNWEEADQFSRNLALSKNPITLSDLIHIQATIEKNNPDQSAIGHIRHNLDDIVRAAGPSGLTYVLPEDVKTQLENTMEWINKQCEACEKNGGTNPNPIVIAASAYQRLVSIHPFHDGNGRTCRLVMDYVLQRFNLPPAAMGESTDSVKAAAFAILPQYQAAHKTDPSETPTAVVERVIIGVERSIEMLK